MLAIGIVYMSSPWSRADVQNTPANEPKTSEESRFAVTLSRFATFGVLQATKHALYVSLFSTTDWYLQKIMLRI